MFGLVRCFPPRFCSDCKHNVVQAHDILMGKIELEGSENEEEFDEVRRRPFVCICGPSRRVMW